MKNQKRLISCPYLSAFIFLNLAINPIPAIDNAGRVSFEFPDSPEIEEAIRKFYADETVRVFTYSNAVKAIKSIIFAMRSGSRDSSG